MFPNLHQKTQLIPVFPPLLFLPGRVSTQREDRLQGTEATTVGPLQAVGVAKIARTRPGDTARAEAPAEDHLRLLIITQNTKREAPADVY